MGVLHCAGNAAECRLGAVGRRWDHDGPAVECPMSQCAMDQTQGGFLLADTPVDKHARGREGILEATVLRMGLFQIATFEIWSSKKPPCCLDQWRKNVGIGTRLAKEGEGECLRIFEISTAHLH